MPRERVYGGGVCFALARRRLDADFKMSGVNFLDLLIF